MIFDILTGIVFLFMVYRLHQADKTIKMLHDKHIEYTKEVTTQTDEIQRQINNVKKLKLEKQHLSIEKLIIWYFRGAQDALNNRLPNGDAEAAMMIMEAENEIKE